MLYLAWRNGVGKKEKVVERVYGTRCVGGVRLVGSSLLLAPNIMMVYASLLRIESDLAIM